MSTRTKLGLGVAIVSGLLFGALIVLRVCGLLRPFSVPTGAMSPAVSAGDHVLAEGFTFLSRQPRRGDLVVFRTAGIAMLPQDQVYVKRVAGQPGDRVELSGGKLFVNNKQVSLSNAVGEIVYDLPPIPPSTAPITNLTVPVGSYFVLGDNATNSFDSRFYGCVPRGNIIGRIAFCYWPRGRTGTVK